MIEIVERLAVVPNSGRIVPEFGTPELREAIHADCRILYLLRDEQIIVLGVRHARRRLRERDVREGIGEADSET